MKKVILFFILILAHEVVFSQCNPYYSLKKGVSYELETYSSKDKKTGRIVNQVADFSSSSNEYEATINSTTFDKKDKEVNSGNYKIFCKNGAVQLDMKSLFPTESLAAYENMDIVFSGEHLDLPPQLNIGDKLKDGSIKGEVKDKESGSTFSTFDFNITDRTVEGKETVTTPAGTFDCFKVTYNMNMVTNMMGVNIPMNFKGIDFITEEVGVVKSENYNKNGKLNGYTLLTKIN